jgi:TPR repeat protein
MAASPTESLKNFRKAAELGNSWAQYTLGDKYATGAGVAPSYPTAIAWYRKAADQGNAWSQFKLAQFYEKGTGVVQNDATAAKLYKASADQGNHLAQASYGLALETGKGLKRWNKVEAVRYYKLAVANPGAPAWVMKRLTALDGAQPKPMAN